MIVVLEWRTSQIIPSTHHFILYYLSLSWSVWYDNFHCLLILFFFLLATLFVMSSHRGTHYCIEHTLYYFIIYGIFRASIPLKKPKHTTHLLRNIYLYLHTNRCSTIDPGPIVKCAVSRVLRLFCHDLLHDYLVS